jgi:hypothetical protein
MPAFQSFKTEVQSTSGWSSKPSAHASTASETGVLGGSSGAGWMKALCSAREASRDGAPTAAAAAAAGGRRTVDGLLLPLLLLLLPVLPLALLLCLLLVF